MSVVQFELAVVGCLRHGTGAGTARPLSSNSRAGCDLAVSSRRRRHRRTHLRWVRVCVRTFGWLEV